MKLSLENLIPPEDGVWPVTQPMPVSMRVRRSMPEQGVPDRLIILVHGQSHSDGAMMRAARQKLRKQFPQAVIDAPCAPFTAHPDKYPRALRARNILKSFCWFELPKRRFFPERELVPPIRQSTDMLHQHIDRTKSEFGFGEDKVNLIGFSQGGVIATLTALERKDSVNPVFNLCGLFFDPAIFGMTEPASRPPVFYAMVQGDETVKAPLSYHTLYVMKKMGLDVTVHVTPSKNQSLGVTPSSAPDIPSEVRHIQHHYYAMENGRRSLKVDNEYTAHWVNPQIERAMLHYHTERSAKTEFNMFDVRRMDFPRVTLRLLKLGWMVKPVRTHAIRDPEQPQTVWNHLSQPISKGVSHLLDFSLQFAVKHYRQYLFELPDIDIEPTKLEQHPEETAGRPKPRNSIFRLW